MEKRNIMENIQKVESWIEAIESSNLSKNEQEKRINALVDLWKFSSSYDDSLQFKDVPGDFIKIDNGSSTQISIHCESLKVEKEHDITLKFLSEIEVAFKNEERYAGLYKIELNKALPNFSTETLKVFKDEIVAAIKGEVILYHYVAKLTKYPADKVMFGNQNFTILNFDKSFALDYISKIENRVSISSPKWLVLMLHNLDDQCDFYTIENDFSDVLDSDFEKIFIFDFYKAEVIEVKVMESKFKLLPV